MAGLAACSFALMSAIVALYRTRQRLFFAVIAVTELLLIADMLWNIRWHLHNALVDAASSRGLYEKRSGPQELSLLLLSVLVVIALAWLSRKLRMRAGMHPGVMLATTGLMLSLAFRVIDVISYHAVDSILYAKTLGLMNIAYVWMVTAAMTAAGALWECRIYSSIRK